MSQSLSLFAYPRGFIIFYLVTIFSSLHIITYGLVKRPHSNENRTHSIPHNISVVLTQWVPPAIRVSWSFTPDPEMISESEKHPKMFRVIYFPVGSKTRYVQEVPINMRNITIEQLVPNTEYHLLINVVSARDLIGNSSHFIRFVSPDGEPHRFIRGGLNPVRIRLDADQEINVRPGEVIIVVAVLIVWMLIIFTFIKKWGKIRTLEPTRQRTDTESLSSFQQKTRFTSIGNSAIPQLHTSDSRNSNEMGNCSSLNNFQRPRLNSVFLASPSRRSSLLPEQYLISRRYKSAEDLKSLVVQTLASKKPLCPSIDGQKSSSFQQPSASQLASLHNGTI